MGFLLKFCPEFQEGYQWNGSEILTANEREFKNIGLLDACVFAICAVDWSRNLEICLARWGRMMNQRVCLKV